MTPSNTPRVQSSKLNSKNFKVIPIGFDLRNDRLLAPSSAGLRRTLNAEVIGTDNRVINTSNVAYLHIICMCISIIIIITSIFITLLLIISNCYTTVLMMDNHFNYSCYYIASLIIDINIIITTFLHN